MNDEQYLQHCRQQFSHFSAAFMQRTETLPETDSLRELASRFDRIAQTKDDLYALGSGLVSRLFDTYPDFAPTFPRELLWFLGGECLHYMPDEEITLFQQLDELRESSTSRGEILDFNAARAKLLKSQ